MKIVTSLSFRGQCTEAFAFYAKVLGGKVTAAIPYGDAPPGMPISDPKYKTWLMHCWLEVGDQAIMGADMDVDWAPNIDKPKNGFDVTLHSASVDEARRWFDQLSAGGKVSMPFGETFWSPGFGGLVDSSACLGWSIPFRRRVGSRRVSTARHVRACDERYSLSQDLDLGS